MAFNPAFLPHPGMILAIIAPRSVPAQKLATVPEIERQQKPMFHLNRSY
jgi:hypothetical protein